ncbi:MAG: hypothetical protein JST93_02790 [Acidobacteria bacterium]|nr:hypothetical protein [Acidobacteriota bacterium]
MRLFFLIPLLATAQQPIDVGLQRQLFIDGKFVTEAKNVTFRMHPPRKTNEFAITSESPFDLGGYSSVVEHDGLYHLYYIAGTAVCYARSKDGIHWEKPSLQLSQAHGTKFNNVVIGYGAAGVKEDIHGLSVFIDPKAPAEERFRLVTNPEEFDRYLQVFSSADGIHWRHTHKNVMTYNRDRKPHHLDSPNVIFYDTNIERYVAYVRKNLRDRNSQGRSVARAESADLANFGRVEDAPPVFRADTLHPGHRNPKTGADTAILDVYTNGTMLYPYAQSVYLMFPTIYYHYIAAHREYRDDTPTNAGPLDARFATSRDGKQWKLHDDGPFIGIGVRGEWDSQRTYITRGIVPAANGHEMYMYYMGTNEPHGWDRDDRNNQLLTKGGVNPVPERRAISRVVLRRDGFVSVRANKQGGEFLTPPMKFQGDQLVLNIDTGASGEATVTITDEQGQPIEGYTSDIIHSANQISHPVTFNLATDLTKLSGKTIRLRIRLIDTDLYAFQFNFRANL